MDFEVGITGLPLTFGAVGTSNLSDVNLIREGTVPLADKYVARWSNKYQYLGMIESLRGNVIDGINARGLYIGGLYLPGLTRYPEYDKSNSAPALSVFDMPNYVLGRFASVNEAVAALTGPGAAVQVVKSALRIADLVYKLFPLHFMLMDTSGDRAIIEFIDGKMKLYHDASYRVLTNSPDFTWQMNNYQYIAEQFFPHNTNYIPPGATVYQNGSGYLGLPGDMMPASRFVRASAIVDAAPSAYSDNQAYYVAKSAISSVAAGLGLSPDATLWQSTFNLKSGDYFVESLIQLVVNRRVVVLHQSPADAARNLKQFNIQRMTKAEAARRNMIPARITRGIKYVLGVSPPPPTQPDTPYGFSFVKGLPRVNTMESSLPAENGAQD